MGGVIGPYYKYQKSDNRDDLLLKNLDFASVPDFNMGIFLAFKHSNLVCPEFSVSYIQYSNGNYSIYLKNPTVCTLSNVYELNLTNRFHLFNNIMFRGVNLSFSTGVKYGMLDGFIGLRGEGKDKYYFYAKGDSTIFTFKDYQLSNNSFSLTSDIQLEIPFGKNIDLGVGLSYILGLVQLYRIETDYVHLSKEYYSNKHLNGGGFFPFIKLGLKL